MLLASCAPKAFFISQPKLVSVYFDREINKLEKKNSPNIADRRLLIKKKIEYGFGVIMEEANRMIDEDYARALMKYKKANKIFIEARESGLSIISEKYPEFNSWLRKESSINFQKEDVSDMYWLAASYGGSISSSRGDPFELINLPKVGRILNQCIQIDPAWNNGSLFSAMMSFTATRSDINEKMLRDSVDFYFDKAVKFSNGMDAGPYMTYAESIHKTFQERKDFVNKLNYVLKMEIVPKSDFELTNLLAKNRAKWLLTKTDEYFLE